jgi:hypothetical protein
MQIARSDRSNADVAVRHGATLAASARNADATTTAYRTRSNETTRMRGNTIGEEVISGISE